MCKSYIKYIKPKLSAWGLIFLHSWLWLMASCHNLTLATQYCLSLTSELWINTQQGIIILILKIICVVVPLLVHRKGLTSFELAQGLRVKLQLSCCVQRKPARLLLAHCFLPPAEGLHFCSFLDSSNHYMNQRPVELHCAWPSISPRSLGLAWLASVVHWRPSNSTSQWSSACPFFSFGSTPFKARQVYL